MKLTKANLAKVVYPQGKAEFILYDEDVPGFGIRMHPTGRRTWFVQFRIGAKQRRMALGTADKLNADDARKRAKAALAKAQLGTDPQAEKSASIARISVTLGATVPRYLAHAETRQKPGHHADTKRYLTRHWAPLKGKALSDIDRASVSARLNDIAKESGPFAANRARAALSAFFTWAIGEGVAHANPTAGTNKPTAEVSRDRVLTDAELALVWNLAGPGDFGAIVRLLILTGCRREEVGAMTWSEIDGDLWRIDGSRTKNGLPHEVPLAPAALAVLGDVPRRVDRDLVFGSRAGPFAGWSKSKADLDARMLAAVREERGKTASVLPWRLHDLRRTTATRMVDLGVLPHVVEAVLNHISGHRAGVAGVYNRAAYAAEKRAAFTLWAEHVASLERRSAYGP